MLILEFLRPFVNTYQNIVAYQLLKLPNPAGFSHAKFPLFVANSSAPRGRWEEFRIGQKEMDGTSLFFSTRYMLAGPHQVARQWGPVRFYGSCKSKNLIFIS